MPNHETPTPATARRQYATIDEVANYLGVTERTIRQMIHDGRLRAYRIGKLIRLDLNDVDDAMRPYGGSVQQTS